MDVCLLLTRCVMPFPRKGTETVGAVRRKRGPSSDKREGEGVSSFKGRYTEKSEARQNR